MGKYTSLILFISGMEDEDERIKEVNSYELDVGRSINLTDMNEAPYPDFFPRFIYCGAYKNLDLEKLLFFLKEKVNWKYPEHNSLIVQVEGEGGLRFYNLK